MPANASTLPRPPQTDDLTAYLEEAEAFRRSGPALYRWATAFRIESGAPLDFAMFPFQEELYNAFGELGRETVDVMKSAQCGISALGVSLALYIADVWGGNVVYVLPTGSDVFDFSDTRVKPSIEDSRYLRSRVESTDNKGLKRVGSAHIYFRGSVSASKTLSIPADLLVLDEFDRLDQRNVPKLYKRLGSPTSMRLVRRFSNPSYPEDGIHGAFLETDQRTWLIRCGCGHEASIAYDEADGSHHVDPERVARVCGRCHTELGRDAIAGGRWVAARPGIEARGYHISKLIVPDQDLGGKQGVVTNHAKTDEDSVTAHYNFDLGLPYAPRGGSLSEALVLACRRDWAMPDHFDGSDWVTAGVDVGTLLHVRISGWLPNGKALPLYIGEVHDFDELHHLWARYSVNFGVIDERPEERAARAFAEAHRGRAYLTRWSGSEQRDSIVADDDRLLLIARRTAACDRTVATFTEQNRLLPRDLPAGYLKMVTAPHRVIETNPAGQKVARYVSERADHYFFAECYDLLAREARGGAAADAGGPAPEVASGGTVHAERRSRWRT